MKQLESLVKRAVPALLLLLCSTLYAQAQGNGFDVRERSLTMPVSP